MTLGDLATGISPPSKPRLPVMLAGPHSEDKSRHCRNDAEGVLCALAVQPAENVDTIGERSGAETATHPTRALGDPVKTYTGLNQFLAVCATRNLTAAAEILGISQPALTQAIAKLERQLGVQVLDRSTRPLGITPYGELVADYARSLDRNATDFTEKLQAMKTGALISCSVESGAILGRIPPEARTGIRGYAHDIGLAFQIRDDLLNLTAAEGDAALAPGITSGAYGKERGGDIAEGKRTLIIIDLLRKCTAGEKDEILQILHADREDTTQEQIERVIGLVDHYDAMAYAESLSHEWGRQSRQHLEQLPATPTRDRLQEMLEFFVQRAF